MKKTKKSKFLPCGFVDPKFEISLQSQLWSFISERIVYCCPNKLCRAHRRRTHGCAETASFLVCPGPAPDGSCLRLQVSPIRVTGFWCFVVASNRVTSRNIRTQRRGVKTLKLAGNSITKIFMFNVFQHLKKRLKQSFQWFGNHEIKYLNIWIYFGKHTDRWTHVKIPFILQTECLPLKRNFNWCMVRKWRVRNRFTNREIINFSKRRFDFGCKIIQQRGMKPMLCYACGFEVWGFLDLWLWNKSLKTDNGK